MITLFLSFYPSLGGYFQTRKYQDFKLWCIAVRLHKLGYHCILEGRKLLVLISSCINKKRYSIKNYS